MPEWSPESTERYHVVTRHKSDFDGNSKVSSFNIHAYANVYGARCLDIGAQVLPPKGYAEGYHDNVCILQDAGNAYLNIQGIRGAKCIDGTPASKQIFEDGMQVCCALWT